MGRFGRKVVRQKQAPVINWAKKKFATYKENEQRAFKEVMRRADEIKGYVLRRFNISIAYVLMDKFSFRKAQFTKLNENIDYMSDVVEVTKDFSVWDVEQGLLEECKYELKKHKYIEMDVDTVKDLLLNETDEKKIDKKISFGNIFDAYATNASIPLYQMLESIVMWSLRLMGFGKKRLARFQDSLFKLWDIEYSEQDNLQKQIIDKLGREYLKLGTKPIHLPILKRPEVAA